MVASRTVNPLPTLSFCVLTKDSGTRLATLLADGRAFADEIVVGVDASSSDRTFEVAAELADVVFRFEHTGLVGPARMLPLQFAAADWILALDDDERMDSAFRPLLPSLLSDDRYTHYWFPRKWVADAHPPTYLRALPWFPDWQPRLFRNDPRIVWCPPTAHSIYKVMGTGAFEDRTAVVHYERLIRTDRDRRHKLRRRRDHLGNGRFEDFFGPANGASTAPLEHAPAPISGRPSSDGLDAKVIEGVQPSSDDFLPPWGAELSAGCPQSVGVGRHVVVDVTAINRGALRWIPPAVKWPSLFLSYHLRDGTDRLVRWDGERTPVGRIVDPGESLRFLALLTAPDEPGDYVLEWDLVSEGECWFAECGSRTLRTRISVVASP
jgi:hypothetical protein